MLQEVEISQARNRAIHSLREAGSRLTEDEEERLMVADFGMSDLSRIGLQSCMIVDTDRVSVKEIALFPRQTCPEHRHPPVGIYPGKEQTFRCQIGVVYFYVPGDPAPNPQAHIPHGYEKGFTVFHEIILEQHEQITIPANTLHWFQAGDEGAVISEYSTENREKEDIFTDPRVRRTFVRPASEVLAAHQERDDRRDAASD